MGLLKKILNFAKSPSEKKLAIDLFKAEPLLVQPTKEYIHNELFALGSIPPEKCPIIQEEVFKTLAEGRANRYLAQKIELECRLTREEAGKIADSMLNRTNRKISELRSSSASIEYKEDTYSIKHEDWVSLRWDLKRAKKDKKQDQVIEVSTKILSYAEKHEELGIVKGLFEKEIGLAYERKKDFKMACNHYKNALALLKKDSNDWTKEEQTLERKIEKLTSKK